MKHWVGLGAATIFVATSAVAQTPAADEAQTPTAASRDTAAADLDVELSGRMLIAMQSVCRTDLDTVGCSQASFRGLGLAPHWRPNEQLALGASGAYLWSPEVIGGATQRMWQLFADARVSPWAGSAVEPWGGVLAGVTSVHDGLDAAAVTHYAPTAGLGLGADVPLASMLALTANVTALLPLFGEPKSLGTGETTDYGATPWLGLSLGLSLRAPIAPSRETVASRR